MVQAEKIGTARPAQVLRIRAVKKLTPYDRATVVTLMPRTSAAPWKPT